MEQADERLTRPRIVAMFATTTVSYSIRNGTGKLNFYTRTHWRISGTTVELTNCDEWSRSLDEPSPMWVCTEMLIVQLRQNPDLKHEAKRASSLQCNCYLLTLKA